MQGFSYMIMKFIQNLLQRKKSNEKLGENQQKVRNVQMPKKANPPSIKKKAFDCPHCGAFTTQYWYNLFADELEKNSIPRIPNKESMALILKDEDMGHDDKEYFEKWYKKISTGLVSFGDDNNGYGQPVDNLHLSKCYHCNKITVWVHDKIVFPAEKQGVMPNQDLPEDIIQDFEEARSIVGLSPRGAAALLRLCIQKLCKHLGEKGKRIDDDIASLVAKGLNPLVQKSLDIVRVIGNEAVHPGVIDLNDDRDTANKLFDLVNSIADQMITHPKNVKALYGDLPETKRKAIEDRDSGDKKK